MAALEDVEGWHFVGLQHIVRFALHSMIGTARNGQMHFARRTEYDHCPNEEMLGDIVASCWRIRYVQVHDAVQLDVDLFQFRRILPVDFLAGFNVDVKVERRLDQIKGGKFVPVLKNKNID